MAAILDDFALIKHSASILDKREIAPSVWQNLELIKIVILSAASR
jgi:hypothetical protein